MYICIYVYMYVYTYAFIYYMYVVKSDMYVVKIAFIIARKDIM